MPFIVNLSKRSLPFRAKSALSDWDWMALEKASLMLSWLFGSKKSAASPAISGKQLAFVLCAASGEGPKALERINAEYPNARVIALKEPNKYPEELTKLAGLFPDDTTI